MNRIRSSTFRSKMCAYRLRSRSLVAGMMLAASLIPKASFADEGGVSFWLPGLYGSLAAVPASAPGWELGTFFYNTSLNAGSDVSTAREIEIGRLNPRLNLNLTAHLNNDTAIQWVNPSYVFATPFLGGAGISGHGWICGLFENLAVRNCDRFGSAV